MERIKLKNAEDYWHLAALHNRLQVLQLEETVLQERYARTQEQRAQIQQKWVEALKEAGKRAGAKGDPERWQVTLGDSPESSYIEYHTAAGGEQGGLDKEPGN